LIHKQDKCLSDPDRQKEVRHWYFWRYCC